MQGETPHQTTTIAARKRAASPLLLVPTRHLAGLVGGDCRSLCPLLWPQPGWLESLECVGGTAEAMVESEGVGGRSSYR